MKSARSKPSDYRAPRLDCPLCGSGKIAPLYRIGRYARPFTIDRCGACGFMFMNPLFSEQVIRDMYVKEYYSGEADYSYQDERAIEPFAMHVWRARLKKMSRCAPHGNFLDVGAAFGGFMKAAAEYFTPYGIELSGYAGQHALDAFPGRVHIGTLEDHPFGDGFFSAITMIELIEHLADPARAIMECSRLLKAGGLLVVQTANMQGRQALILGDDYEYFMPGHLSYFSMENLTCLLKECGFSRIRVFYPVEFGLVPKLRKSRHAFRSPADYRAWLRIAWYHAKSKVHCGRFAMTSSMVIYAIK
jgi:SAM-dependent methyltransferase